MRLVGPLAAAVIALGGLTACDTIQDTKAKAAELEKLATSSPDEQVKKALEEAANGMQNVGSAADWVTQKAALVEKVSSACGG